LPAVLAIMLLLVLSAGAASMAISAVLQQQTANHASTVADLSSQNTVAAVAANVAGGSACAPPSGAAPGTLFQSSDPPPNGMWTLSGSWTSVPALEAIDTNSTIDVASPNVPTASSWSDYSVSVDLTPGSIATGTWSELDAYRGSGSGSFYYLRLEDGQQWSFGKLVNGHRFPFPYTLHGPSYPYGTTQPVPLELDVFGTEITAKIDGRVFGRRADSSPLLPGGSIAIRAQASQVEVDNVLVDQPVSPSALPTLPNLNLPSPGLPTGFFCQRVDGINTGVVSQQRVVPSNASGCSSLSASVSVPGLGGHVRIWFVVPWPAGTTPTDVTVGLGGCSPGTADCARQRSTVVRDTSGSPWSPGLTVVGADCTNLDPTQGQTSYTVYISARASFPPMTVRSAAAAPGGGSVYVTLAAVRAQSGEPYGESDILKPVVGPVVLSYEGVLG
jgi:hypothetical protein